MTGQSGGGKSSLIANWWRSRTHVSKKEGPAKALLANTNTFIHFIGMNTIFRYLNTKKKKKKKHNILLIKYNKILILLLICEIILKNKLRVYKRGKRKVLNFGDNFVNFVL